MSKDKLKLAGSSLEFSYTIKKQIAQHLVDTFRETKSKDLDELLSTTSLPFLYIKDILDIEKEVRTIINTENATEGINY